MFKELMIFKILTLISKDTPISKLNFYNIPIFEICHSKLQARYKILPLNISKYIMTCLQKQMCYFFINCKKNYKRKLKTKLRMLKN